MTPLRRDLVEHFRALAVFALGSHQGDLADFCLARADDIAALPEAYVPALERVYRDLAADFVTAQLPCAGMA